MRAALTRRAGLAGIAVASIVVLAGCGTGGDAPEASTMLTELGEFEGQVSILAWPGYVEDGTNYPNMTGCPRSKRRPVVWSPPRRTEPPTRPSTS